MNPLKSRIIILLPLICWLRRELQSSWNSPCMKLNQGTQMHAKWVLLAQLWCFLALASFGYWKCGRKSSRCRTGLWSIFQVFQYSRRYWILLWASDKTWAGNIKGDHPDHAIFVIKISVFIRDRSQIRFEYAKPKNRTSTSILKSVK